MTTVNPTYFVAEDKRGSDLKLPADLILHHGDTGYELDPITYEVLRHRLWQINDEQRLAISRVSGSAVATDANDFNVAIGNEYGDIVTVGSGILYHILDDLAIKWVLEHRGENPGIEDGDMFLKNDPWIAGIHQNDVTVMQPVFWDGELFCWTTASIHQVDVGGINPGSFCFDAVDAYSEGTIIPPIKIVERGELRRDLEELYLRQSRTPELLALDLRAFIAGHNVAKDRLLETIEQYGAEAVKATMTRLMDEAERLFRERLAALPDGEWRHTGYHEASRTGDRGVYGISTTIRKKGDGLHFDFAGTDPQAGVINCTYGGLKGGSLSVVLSTLCSDIPWAVGGITRAVSFSAEPGTLNNATFPAGVSAGAIAGTCHTINVVTSGLAKMLSSHPEYRRQLICSSLGAWATMYFSAIDQRGEPDVNILMDAMSAGLGARSFADGVNTGGIIHAPAGQIPNVEQNELFHPVLYLYRREEIDSGGPGKLRGGVGAALCVVPHDTDHPIDWQWFSYGQAFPTSVGICGGWPTKCTEATILRGTAVQEWFERCEVPESLDAVGGERIDLLPKGTYRQELNDLFHCYWQGGGGYGDPLERDSRTVAKDVFDHYVSVTAARDIYGVIVDPEAMSWDKQATDELRRKIRDARSTVEPRTQLDKPLNGRRLDETLLIDERGDTICSRCASVISHQGESYKQKAVEQVRDFRDTGLLGRDPGDLIDRKVVFRQYFCPGCGINLENDVVLAEVAPVLDKRLY
jgi:N-methylhydantoinase B